MLRDVAPRSYGELVSIASRSTVDRAVRAGELTRLLPDRYCLSAYADSWAMRAHAAVDWAGPGAGLAGLAALAVFGYAPLPIANIQVVVPPGRQRPTPPWLQLRSLSVPFKTATWERRTAVILPQFSLPLVYGSLPDRERATFVHGAIKAGVTDASALGQALLLLPHVSHRRELARRVALIAAGAESYLEERGMGTVFRGAAREGIVFQHRIRVRGERYRVDAFHVAPATAFEFDGNSHHGSPAARQRDVTRDANMATIGVLTVRFTFRDVADRPQWCAEIAREVIASRRTDA